MPIKLKMVKRWDTGTPDPLIAEGKGFRATYIYSYDRIDIFPVRERPGGGLSQPYGTIAFAATDYGAKIRWIDIKAYTTKDLDSISWLVKKSISFMMKHHITPKKISEAIIKARMSRKRLVY